MVFVSGGREDSVASLITRQKNPIGQSRSFICSTLSLFSFTVDKSNTKGQAGSECGSDSVAIPGGSLTGHGESYERWCGSLFGAMNPGPPGSASENQVTTYRTPFR